MQLFRHTIQILVLIFMVIIAYVNYYGVMLEQRNDEVIQNSLPLASIHSIFKGKERSKVINTTHAIKGTVWTLDINGFKISDPLAVLESTTVTFSLYVTLIVSALIPIIATVLLGRFFCGWICPMHLILEINDKLRILLSKIGYNVRDVSFNRNAKYIALVVGLVTAFFIGMPLLSLIYPPAIISREILYRIYRGIWSNGVFILGTICFIELILSKRWWCRYICPGGAIYCLLSKVKILTITKDNDKCTQCGMCDKVCPYDLQPMTQELKIECDQCRLCISSCSPKALSHTFRLIKRDK